MLTAPTLYFDRSIGKALPEALKILRVQNIIHHATSPDEIGINRNGNHKGLFNDNAPDDEWLSFVGNRGWVAISQDYNMHREPAPLAAIQEHNVKVFYLWGANATRWEKMRLFAKVYDNIISTACALEGPFVFRVVKSGELKRINLSVKGLIRDAISTENLE